MSDSSNPIQGLEAKKVSTRAMVFAAIWIGVLTITKGIMLTFGKEFLSIKDIIATGITIASVFAPISISIWISKFQDLFGMIKNNNSNKKDQGEGA